MTIEERDSSIVRQDNVWRYRLMNKEYKVKENGIEYDIKEYANGSKHWYLNGELHRENGLPAAEHASGDKFWFFNGKRHRENGLPEIEYANGDKFWYINGVEYKENDIISLMNKTFVDELFEDIDKCLMI